MESAPVLSTPEEELAYLREQVRRKQGDLTLTEASGEQARIISKAAPSEILAPEYQMKSRTVTMAANRIIAELALGEGAAAVEQLEKVVEEKGIKNAFSVLEKLQNPRVADDFHRYLVRHVAAGLATPGADEKQPRIAALRMTLYEIALPGVGSRKQEAGSRKLKELISGMEQLYAGLQSVGEPVAGIKSAAPPEAQPQDPAAGLQIYRSDESAPMETVAPTFTPPPEEPAPRPMPTPKVVVTQAPPVQAAPPPATSQALKPAIPPAPVQKAAPAPAQKVAAAPPAPKPAPPAVQKTEPAPAAKPAAGGAVVQIGAVSSTALADKAWKDAVSAVPGLGAGKGKSVEKIEKNGGTLYRTAVTGFASRADAQAFCAKLQAAGKSCFVR